jgi:hypothetical protein
MGIIVTPVELEAAPFFLASTRPRGALVAAIFLSPLLINNKQ